MDVGNVCRRVENLEYAVGKLSLQIGQFMRTGLADADNYFTSEPCFDELAECSAWRGVFGPAINPEAP